MNDNTDRLENEHLGNTDQYRVTREVPLPYSFDNDGDDRDSVKSGDEGDDLRPRDHEEGVRKRVFHMGSVGSVPESPREV